MDVLTIFRDELTRSDAPKTLKVSSEDRRRLKHRDGDGDELCVCELGFNAFQLELGGLSEDDTEESGSNEESTESHRKECWERKNDEASFYVG